MSILFIRFLTGTFLFMSTISSPEFPVSAKRLHRLYKYLVACRIIVMDANIIATSSIAGSRFWCIAIQKKQNKLKNIAIYCYCLFWVKVEMRCLLGPKFYLWFFRVFKWVLFHLKSVHFNSLLLYSAADSCFIQHRPNITSYPKCERFHNLYT